MTTHQQWIRVLDEVKAHSHDLDTQTACIIVDRLGCVVARAANRIPDGVEVKPERLARPAKYTWIQHAERRAVCIAADQGRSTALATMYLNWFPCVDCAQVIAQAGIRRLYAHKAQYEARKDDPRYGFAEAMAILQESGVRVEWF